MENLEHKKMKIAMRYFLLGRGYLTALKSMEFASKVHTGYRKDGKTPEFDHQIRIAHYVRTLPDLMFPEESLATVFLHDVPEDYDYSFDELENLFGRKITESVRLLTKKFRGNIIPLKDYYEQMASCPIASIVKGADRIHNFQSMVGVFGKQKQIKYIEECQEFILPMLKKARRLHSSQESSYQNEKLVLNSQIELIKAIHIEN